MTEQKKMAQQKQQASPKTPGAKIQSSSSVSVEPEAVSIDLAQARLESAARVVFRDPRVRSLGITRNGEGFGYRAVRNSAMITPEKGFAQSSFVNDFGIPVTYVDTPHELEHQLKVPHSGPGAPAASSHVLEQDRARPLVSGLQIQNYDDDARTGAIGQGYIVIGTIGCFVDLADNSVALLSNNHVVAGENRGINGTDRIQQPGASNLIAGDLVGILQNFIPLQTSPTGASVATGNVLLNQVDAGVAILQAGVTYAQGFLPTRALTAPNGTASANVGDKVFKVGRTTGLTHGQVMDIGTIVGPIVYDPGSCWFEQSLTIEGENGTMFSDKGDSGSIIVREDGMIVGLLYAGNGAQTYACPIDLVFSALQCTLH